MKRIISAVAVIALGAALFLSACQDTAGTAAETPETEEQLESLYTQAMEDSMLAEESEILPLVEITPDSDQVTWDENGEKVLMIFWNDDPDSYIAGEPFYVSEYGEVWAFTDQEIETWYQKNKDDVTDWDLRFKQLIGLPEDEAYTHFTSVWVNPDDLIRPAYETDITRQVTADDLAREDVGEYQEWFDDNIQFSYYDSAYPWTRMGYTYDWADNGTEYGLSEFMILPGSEIEVTWTVPTDEFLGMLESGDLAP